MRNIPFGYSSRSRCSIRRAIDRLSPWMRLRSRRKFPRIINHYQERRGEEGVFPGENKGEAKQEQCFAIGVILLLVSHSFLGRLQNKTFTTKTLAGATTKITIS